MDCKHRCHRKALDARNSRSSPFPSPHVTWLEPRRRLRARYRLSSGKYRSHRLQSRVNAANIVCHVDIRRTLLYKHEMDQPFLYRQIGSRIRSRRKQLGLTQETLAGQLGLSRASLANIETGRQSVLVHRLYPIAQILELSVADLLPPPPTTLPDPDASDLPLPRNLSPQQRKQIARILSDEDSP